MKINHMFQKHNDKGEDHFGWMIMRLEVDEDTTTRYSLFTGSDPIMFAEAVKEENG